MERKREPLSLKEEIYQLVKSKGRLSYEQIAEELGIDLSVKYDKFFDPELGYIKVLRKGAGVEIWNFSGALDNLVNSGRLNKEVPGYDENKVPRSIYSLPDSNKT